MHVYSSAFNFSAMLSPHHTTSTYFMATNMINGLYFFLLKAMCENNMKVYPMRLQPGTEIKSSLVEFVTSRQLNAAFILTCCGSVRKATLRFATCPDQTHQVCFKNHNSYSFTVIQSLFR